MVIMGIDSTPGGNGSPESPEELKRLLEWEGAGGKLFTSHETLAALEQELEQAHARGEAERVPALDPRTDALELAFEEWMTKMLKPSLESDIAAGTIRNTAVLKESAVSAANALCNAIEKEAKSLLPTLAYRGDLAEGSGTFQAALARIESAARIHHALSAPLFAAVVNELREIVLEDEEIEPRDLQEVLELNMRQLKLAVPKAFEWAQKPSL